ncbi:LDL receptor repeat-containing protein egg-1-like [Ruditapes philippinarum]|uniref:LDL receptor repeat-containing protein egg-1-like n=1 Tax=Ruditapes philippinarum TaxID=129788 RepID=UPI00295B5915|nr:LDL receptor repeat-containing protein egg-1-like [Ruditapes philippinarum]
MENYISAYNLPIRTATLFYNLNIIGCDDNEFSCDGGHCIKFSEVCDFISDCADGTDETCDLQKAFDTVDHNILLMKLDAMGFSSDVIHWFRSYLSSRTQMVNVSGVLSSTANVACGVPQGSILGTLLFLIYVNDMEAVVRNKLLLCADDSGILVSGKDIQYITSQLTDDLSSVSKWLTGYKLSLHLGKTESILFASKPRLRSCDQLNIVCNGTTITSTKSVKYLGADIDQCLSDFQKCDENEFRCENKQCIPSEKRCNAKPDCLDKSDEKNCESCTNSFLCSGDYKCIPLRLTCDRYPDCTDSSDELTCHSKIPTSADLRDEYPSMAGSKDASDALSMKLLQYVKVAR